MKPAKGVCQNVILIMLFLLSLLGSAKARQAPCGSNEPLYVYGDDVSSSQRASIRNGIKIGAQYVCSNTGLDIESLTVYAYADLELLINTFSQVLKIPIGSARDQWQTSAGVVGDSNNIFFYTPRLFSDPAKAAKICAHEYFHVIQYKLTNNNLIGALNSEKEVPHGGPRWLIEGSAEFVAELAVDASGTSNFSLVKEQNRERASTLTTLLNSMESSEFYAGGGNSYSLGLVVCDFLAPAPQPRFSGLQSFVKMWDAVGKGRPWPQAFQTVMGKSISEFYTEFERYRSISFPPTQTLPFAIQLDSVYSSGSDIGSDAPFETIPYVFRVTGFDLNTLTHEQLETSLKRPSNIGWGGTQMGRNFIVLYFRPTTSSGAYTVALDLPDGRHAETTFSHRAASASTPTPNLVTLTPNDHAVGDAGFILTVTGNNFVPGTKGKWNGADRVTRIRNNSTLEIILNGPDIAVAGKAVVTVKNPAPAVGESNPLNFIISNPIAAVSAASYNSLAITGKAIVSVFGLALAADAASAKSIPLPTSLAGTSLKVVDYDGTERLAPLFYVSPAQINFQIPDGTTLGPAAVIVLRQDGQISSGVVWVQAAAPSLFTLNASGAGAATAVDALTGSFAPFSPRRADGQPTIISLFGTGLGADATDLGGDVRAGVTARIDDRVVTVLYAGPAPGLIGLNQLNIVLPVGIAAGTHTIVVSRNDFDSNTVTIDIQ